ncbi:MAG: recombinase RecA [bacterium]
MAGKAKAVTEPVVAKSVASEKQQAILIAMQQITKQFGAGSIMKLGEAHAHMAIEVIPTGSVGLDLALGAGGIPKGRISEIYGPEASGKTTLCLHVIAESQKRGGTAAFIDAEHALDPARAAGIGVNLDELLISQPDTGEQALEIAETLIRSGAVDVIVIDSVAALVPKAEIEGEMGDAMMGLQARLMSQALRKLTGAINKSNTVVIFTNQLREKIGVMFGNPETTTGGKALKFYASVRIDMRKIANITENEKIVGSRHRAKIVKNKIAAPFRVVEFDIMNDGGISKSGSILDVGIDQGVIEKSGSFFRYNGEMLAQGREATKSLLEEKPELMKKIEKDIWTKIKSEETIIEAIPANDQDNEA